MNLELNRKRVIIILIALALSMIFNFFMLLKLSQIDGELSNAILVKDVAINEKNEISNSLTKCEDQKEALKSKLLACNNLVDKCEQELEFCTGTIGKYKNQIVDLNNYATELEKTNNKETQKQKQADNTLSLLGLLAQFI